MHRHLLRAAFAGGACGGSAFAQADPPPPTGFEQALDEALDGALAKQATSTTAPAPAKPPDLFGAPLRLVDLSLDLLVYGGGSTEQDDEIAQLQGGGHDPRQRGFTLSQLELSALGAVDPFFEFGSHLVWFIDPDGESQFELEEAYGRTTALPGGLELKAGHYFTEFGRQNAQHPHQWEFVDQPVIASRLFGEDGMRGTGARLSWHAPLPWFTELLVGMQNADGETMASFGGSDDEGAPGGHEVEELETAGLADFTWSTRLMQSFDLSDETTSIVGLSGAWGPSAAGDSTRSAVYGADFQVKWRARRDDAGWPFVIVQGEAMRRIYGTSLQAIDPDGVPASGDEATVPGDTLHDMGGWLQALWGFRRDWAVGLRFERARSSGDGLVAREDDAARDDRQRLSPLLTWHPSHFSRVRLQANYDLADHLDDHHAWSAWLGLELVVGSHPAHSY